MSTGTFSQPEEIFDSLFNLTLSQLSLKHFLQIRKNLPMQNSYWLLVITEIS
jgi:hypothetical protein